MPGDKTKALVTNTEIVIRPVAAGDEKAVNRLEKASFETDRLSLRRIKYWIKATHRIFLVAEIQGEVLAYGLVLLHKGTKLSRLYSLAADPRIRGMGVGRQLLKALEEAASDENRLFMRLEVASDNEAAIALYQSIGYRVFGSLPDYYEDHKTALRMQKRIRYLSRSLVERETPWYRQTTEFTCGPASLLMAMSSLEPEREMIQDEELDIWREATTIFMTSGHGGSHPVGLGLAARSRGFKVEVYVNQSGPLFVDGVRSEHKKEIVALVDGQFRKKAAIMAVKIHQHDVTQADIARWLGKNKAVLMLISTYRIDGRKAPHWCLYVHDPDPSGDHYNAFDCQYVPVARSDFEKMASFGKSKLRTCIVLSV